MELITANIVTLLKKRVRLQQFISDLVMLLGTADFVRKQYLLMVYMAVLEEMEVS